MPQRGPLTQKAHRIPTAMGDKTALTRLFSTFDLSVTRHAVAQKPSNKYRHTNLLHHLATKSGELSGLNLFQPFGVLSDAGRSAAPGFWIELDTACYDRS